MRKDDSLPFDVPADAFRAWLDRAADFSVRWLERERNDPVLERIDAKELRGQFDERLPVQPASFDDVFAEFENVIARYSRANGHPGYLAYVSASADPVGMIADLLASTLNQNVTAWRSTPAAATIERCVLRWLDELLGFNGGNGVLTGGGSAANFNALSMAIRRAEENGVNRSKMTVHVSTDTHLSIAKAAKVLGIAEDNIRRIGVDAARKMRMDALADAMARDHEEGLVPVFVCASAGTANCGAIDPVDAMAEIARRNDAWLHVDGAYGAAAAMTDSHAWLRELFSLADSLSVDPHKWLYAPLDTGCLLYRDGELAKRTFSESAAYTAVSQTDPEEAFAFFDHGMELSRRFRALKLWFALRIRGSAAFASAIESNIDARRHFDARIASHPRLERVASGLSISCFRATGSDDDNDNALNRRILKRLLDSGSFLLSPTELDGKFVLRICIVNFRTRHEDMDRLVSAIDAALAAEDQADSIPGR